MLSEGVNLDLFAGGLSADNGALLRCCIVSAQGLEKPACGYPRRTGPIQAHDASNSLSLHAVQDDIARSGNKTAVCI